MTVAIAIFLIVHGLIHLLGFVKGFGLAELPQLQHRVSPPMGALWLIAALLFVAAAVSLFAWPRGWWAIGLLAVALSVTAIIPSWSDAKAGAIADGIALVAVIFGFLVHGPVSLETRYIRDVVARVRTIASVERITDADLQRLPACVQEYLRAAGAVGQPRVRNFRARMHGRFRSGPESAWLPFTAEQHNFVDEPARLFYMTASQCSIPFQGYHCYIAASATMRVRLAGLVSVINAAGEEMTQAETVTILNDMCVMAPQALVSPAIAWHAIDEHAAEATYTNGAHSVRAVLEFNQAGELVNFRSDDRYQISPVGKTMKRVTWSTPLRGYRSFGGTRLSSGGEARWHEPDRDYAYIELDLDDVQYNVSSR